MRNNSHFLSSLDAFSEKYKEIYIWGAGHYGRNAFFECKSKGIKIHGFITTEGGEAFERIPVFKSAIVDSLIGNEVGIIIAMHSRNYDGAIKNLISTQRESILIFDENDNKTLQRRDVFPWIDAIACEYPAGKEYNKNAWKNILVIRLDLLGDMIWTTPFLRELRLNFPSATISIIVSSTVYPILKFCPYLDTIYVFDEDLRDSKHTFFEYLDIVKDYCQNFFSGIQFDVVFLPRFISLDVNLLFAIYCKSSIRFGRLLDLQDMDIYSRIRPLFTKISIDNHGSHNVERMLKLIKLFNGTIHDMHTELWYSSEEILWANDVLKKAYGTYMIAIGINAGAKSRSWHPQNFKRLIIDISKKYSFVIFIILGNGDAVEAGKQLECASCIDLTGKTNLLEAEAIIDKCNLYVGADTGLMHMAAAYRKPVIEISAFLPDGNEDHESSPARAGAWGVESVVLMPEHGLDGCKECCRKTYSHCINQISVERVYNAIEKFINRFVMGS